MVYHGYEEVEHTADIAMRVWGEDFETLLKQAAIGMFELLGIKHKPESKVESSFLVQPDSCETVLVDFLNELLYLAEEKHQALSELTIKTSKDALRISITGFEIETQVRVIKAVTYHNLEVKKTEKGIEATITFDV